MSQENYQPSSSSSPASLANMTSTGPTFAAKARAAELNAARSRKKVSEDDTANDPKLPPLSLGDFTVLKPKTRKQGSKVWKPLDLTELGEDDNGASRPEDDDGGSRSSEDSRASSPSRLKAGDRRPHPLRQALNASQLENLHRSVNTASAEFDFHTDFPSLGKGQQMDLPTYPVLEESMGIDVS